METEGIWIRRVFRGFMSHPLLIRRLSGAVENELTFSPGEIIDVPGHLCILQTGIICTVIGGKRTLIRLRNKPFGFEQVLQNAAFRTCVSHYSLSQVTVLTMRKETFFQAFLDFPDAQKKFKQKIAALSIVFFCALYRMFTPYIVYDDDGLPCGFTDLRDTSLPTNAYALTLDPQIKRNILDLLAVYPFKRRVGKNSSSEKIEQKNKGKGQRKESELGRRTLAFSWNRSGGGRAKKDVGTGSLDDLGEQSSERKLEGDRQREQGESKRQKTKEEPSAAIQLAKAPTVMHHIKRASTGANKNSHDDL